jgi:hypothetical protein
LELQEGGRRETVALAPYELMFAEATRALQGYSILVRAAGRIQDHQSSKLDAGAIEAALHVKEAWKQFYRHLFHLLL